MQRPPCGAVVFSAPYMREQTALAGIGRHGPANITQTFFGARIGIICFARSGWIFGEESDRKLDVTRIASACPDLGIDCFDGTDTNVHMDGAPLSIQIVAHADKS